VTDSSKTPIGRLIDALNDPARLFEPEQVAFLMASAYRWGYETRRDEERTPDVLSWHAGHDAGYRQRVTEENATYPAPAVFSAGELDALVRIQGARAAARADRSQVYAGGPVPTWDADRPDHVPPSNVSVRVNTRGPRCEWADA